MNPAATVTFKLFGIVELNIGETLPEIRDGQLRPLDVAQASCLWANGRLAR
jgi:hypothetical protein